MLNFDEEKKRMLTKDLYNAITLIQDLSECENFLIDICTEKEIEALAQRLYVAKLLKDEVTYTEIEKETGASTVTISRVSKALKTGNGGYKMILERIGE